MNLFQRVHASGLPLQPVERARMLVSPDLHRRIIKWVVIVHVVGILIPAIWFGIRQWWLSRRPPVIRVQLVTETSEAAPSFTPPARDSSVPDQASAPRPRPNPNPRKWRALSAKDITVSKDLVRNDPTPSVDASEIENRLKNISRQLQVSNARRAANVVPSSYYDKLATCLYRLWQQPSRAELGGRNPAVGVRVKISSDGSVQSAEIIRASGLGPMDNSVERLLADLRQLPRPPNGAMTLDVSLEVIDE